MTNYSRSVLKSNGYNHPENELKKFEISSKIIFTNLVKKLPSQTLSQTASHRVLQFLSQMAHVCFHRRKWVHTRLSKKDRTQGHTRRNRGISDGGALSLPSDRFAWFGNPACPGLKTANFAAFGSWSGVLSKNTESLRDSDAHERIAVPKASRPRWAA